MLNIASEAQLKDALTTFSSSECGVEHHFGNQLSKVIYGNKGRADLSNVEGRILRSCVLEIFDILRNVCADESMLIHMCFVNRHGIKSCEDGRLVPSSMRLWDGLDELRPQVKYNNEWTPIDVEELKIAIAANEDFETSDLVRSFKCFWESYFTNDGSFAAQLPDGIDRNDITIIPSHSTKPKSLSIDLTWENQESLSHAVLAFSKLAQKKFRHLHEATCNSRTLYLISVGSNVLSWGDPARTNRTIIDRPDIELQAAWVVISLPSTVITDDTLAHFSLAASSIDAAMSQSLVMDKTNELSQKLESERNLRIKLDETLETEKKLKDRLQSDSNQLASIREKILDSSEHYRIFSHSVARVFQTVESSVAVLTNLANDLASTVFNIQASVSYQPGGEAGAEPLFPLHSIDTEVDLQKKFDNNPKYGEDLDFRLMKHLGPERAKAFKEHKKTPLSRAIFMKSCVYRMFSSDHVKDEQSIKFGSFRAALFCRCEILNWDVSNGTDAVPVGGKLDETGSCVRDETAMAIHDGMLIEDANVFISGLSDLINAWLAPGEDYTSWIKIDFKENSDKTRHFDFYGGGFQRHVDSAKMSALAFNAQQAVKRREFSGGGNLQRALFDILSASMHAAPKVEFLPLDKDGLDVGCKLTCRWPHHRKGSAIYELGLIFDRRLTLEKQKRVEFTSRIAILASD